MGKKEQECHKHPHENSRKIPKTTCKKIVDTIFIESVRKLSTLFVRKLTSSIITVSMLLAMNLMLLLDLPAFMKNTMGRAMGMDMVDMGAIKHRRFINS